ncbi:AAA family ATPase [Catenulispora sp. NF23]|uniref:phosphatase domain-containing protein n=1 Tax=Catenulispora pinistramenti TaxID=2705254 RepID=UPI001BA8F62C|nr:AAA family ATPase [Catenulispora pinistramenti]MBS2539640.1 AAA family ATPase [Catenulispora pinistramenti]
MEDDYIDDAYPGAGPDPVPSGPGVQPGKPVVHLMRGLPASGKSTVARQLMAAAEGRMRRVSLDELRRMLDDNDGSKRLGRRHEETVLAVQDAVVLAAVEGGFDIVVDNTHLVSRIPKRLKNLLGGRAAFEVHDLTDVDVEECVRRDAQRPNPVGEEHIRAMALRLASTKSSGWKLNAADLNDVAPAQTYVPDPALPAAVMCDIDGTLADNKGRGPYDWLKVEDDGLIVATADALAAFAARGDRVILMSGRGEDVREGTERWLAKHGVAYDELWMRAAKDTRADDIVKSELFDAHVRNRFAVRVVLDDRSRVVALWRRLGLTCWQVDYGDF